MECIVVGAGLTGAVCARTFAEAGHTVQVFERRNHIAGNVYDFVDSHGFLVQKYGPHAFHTNDEEVFAYINRFCDWHDYRLKCGASIEGRISPVPFNFTTVDMFCGTDADHVKKRLLATFPERATVPVLEMLESADATVSTFARFLFRADYAPYTAKQWGISPTEVDPSVLARVPVRLSYDEGYFDDIHQVLPAPSFTSFVESMLSHPAIAVHVDVDAHNRMDIRDGRVLIDNRPASGPVVYTGALDELFGFAYGRLPYRSLRFEWHYAEQDCLLPYPLVAYPEAPGYTRITEFKQLPPQQGIGTTYAVEFPLPDVDGEAANRERYYPVLTQASAALYERYAHRAADIEGLICCGRLADFRYCNMDEAIRRALDVARAACAAMDEPKSARAMSE